MLISCYASNIAKMDTKMIVSKINMLIHDKMKGEKYDKVETKNVMNTFEKLRNNAIILAKFPIT